MGVVQEQQLGAELGAYGLEDGWQVTQVRLGVPVLHERAGLLVCDGRPLAVGGVDAVDGAQARDAGLDADRRVPLGQPGAYGVEEFGDVAAVRVPVGGDPVAAGPAEQLVEGEPGGLGLDVPQGDVDGGHRGHRDGAAPPVRAPVQVLPGVLDPVRVQPGQQRGDMVGEVAGDGEFAPVEGGVAEAGQPLVGRHLQRDEVPSGTGDDDLGVGDPHRAPRLLDRTERTCERGAVAPPGVRRGA